MIGPGKYDDLCTRIRSETKASGVILIVLGGNRGEGFSAQLTPEATAKISPMLRHLADSIEADLGSPS